MFAHNRPFFLAFVGLMTGLACGLLFGTSFLFIPYVLIGICAVCIVMALIAIFWRTKFGEWFSKNLWRFVVIMIAVALGFGMFFIQKNNYTLDFQPDSSTLYCIYGKADEGWSYNDAGDKIRFILSDVSLNTDTQTIKLKRNLYVSVKVKDEEHHEIVNEILKSMKAGDYVLFYGYVWTSKVFQNGSINTYAYKNNYQHCASVSAKQQFYIFEGEASTIVKVREAFKKTCYDNMEPRYAALAYSVFVGDRTELDGDMWDSFQQTGIVHIIAVSGLNVALIIVVLSWFFKKFRRRIISISIIGVVLFLYCMLCGFAPSVVRASLMGMFLLIGNTLGEQNDNLNSISLAGLIILLVTPLAVFDISFLLSFGAMIGIFFFMPIFSDWFSKMKMPKWLAENIGLTLSAQIGTLPILINTFGQIPLISLLANLIIVPLFGYIFMVMFVLLIIGVIVPFVAKGLIVCQWGYWVVDKMSAFMATLLPLLYLPKIATWGVVSYYGATFAGSRYCVARPMVKYTTFAILCAITILALILGFCGV